MRAIDILFNKIDELNDIIKATTNVEEKLSFIGELEGTVSLIKQIGCLYWEQSKRNKHDYL